jgi:hypothetical protein
LRWSRLGRPGSSNNKAPVDRMLLSPKPSMAMKTSFRDQRRQLVGLPQNAVVVRRQPAPAHLVKSNDHPAIVHVGEPTVDVSEGCKLDLGWHRFHRGQCSDDLLWEVLIKCKSEGHAARDRSRSSASSTSSGAISYMRVICAAV